MLPGMSGLDVCRELRAGERTREIPIIMITAKSEETDQVVGYSLGRRRLRHQAVQQQGAPAQGEGAPAAGVEGPGEPGDVIRAPGGEDRPGAASRHGRRRGARPDADRVPPARMPGPPAGPGVQPPPAHGRGHRRGVDRAGADDRRSRQDAAEEAGRGGRQRRPDRDGPRRRLPVPRAIGRGKLIRPLDRSCEAISGNAPANQPGRFIEPY